MVFFLLLVPSWECRVQTPSRKQKWAFYKSVTCEEKGKKLEKWRFKITATQWHSVTDHLSYAYPTCVFWNLLLYLAINIFVLSPRQQIQKLKPQSFSKETSKGQSAINKDERIQLPHTLDLLQWEWILAYDIISPPLTFQWHGNHAFRQGTEADEGEVLRLHWPYAHMFQDFCRRRRRTRPLKNDVQTQPTVGGGLRHLPCSSAASPWSCDGATVHRVSSTGAKQQLLRTSICHLGSAAQTLFY